jgi:sulfite dehydrogenase (cytochrome) subunit B
VPGPIDALREDSRDGPGPPEKSVPFAISTIRADGASRGGHREFGNVERPARASQLKLAPGFCSSKAVPGCDAGVWSTDMRITAIAMLFAVMTAAAAAGDEPVKLKQAPGLDKVEANCAACHSLDYVQMNSPFLDAAGWEAEVAKMINAYGAPIGPDDARIIADYLEAYYGK